VLQPGDRVGRYEIQAVVGEGGFGKVYRAWDPELERIVAIKELSGERKAREPELYAEYLERFRLERRVQGRFQHPRIVTVYDLVHQNGDEYMVEEFVECGTLRDLIERRSRLSSERVIQIGVEMCQAIGVAWEQDVVHRDIKPSNILLTDEDHVKLTDFGVAQMGHVSQRTQSDSHHPGTPAYMSPEQEGAYGYLDERSDIYSLGLVLYEALTGRSYKRERVAVRQLAPRVPKRLEAAVMRALARDPDERYQRAAEFEAALRDGLDESRPVWLWLGGGAILLLALIRFVVYPSWVQTPPPPTAVATRTATPSPTAIVPTRTSTPTKAPTPTMPFTARPTRTVKPTVTPSLQSTWAPVVSAPRLLSPPGAAQVKGSRITFRWEGELPGSGFGFRVNVRRSGDGLIRTSPIIKDILWTLDLPGDASENIGEWRWSVEVVSGIETGETVARSDEWTFYYDPFGSGASPFDSTLPTPPFTSPLSTPGP
jgi:serine/threonine protein kinase